MSRLFLFGGLVCSCPSAVLLGSCLRRMFVKKFAGASGGERFIQGSNLYACRRGVREKDCSHLRWRKSYKGLN